MPTTLTSAPVSVTRNLGVFSVFVLRSADLGITLSKTDANLDSCLDSLVVASFFSSLSGLCEVGKGQSHLLQPRSNESPHLLLVLRLRVSFHKDISSVLSFISFSVLLT